MRTVKQIRLQSHLRKAIGAFLGACAVIAVTNLKAQSVTLAMADTVHHPAPVLKKISSAALETSASVIAPALPKISKPVLFDKNEMLLVASLRLERQAATHNPLLLVHKNLHEPYAWLNVNAAFGHPAESQLAMREEILDRNEPDIAYIKASFTF